MLISRWDESPRRSHATLARPFQTPRRQVHARKPANRLVSVSLRTMVAGQRSGAVAEDIGLFEGVDARRLMDAFAAICVPRHLFKFMYRLLTAHCNAHTEKQPAWQISASTFESVLAFYQRDQDAFDRGVGAG
jgi:hypothetical protein